MTKAPDVSIYAIAIISRGNQILLPFMAGDASIAFKSRWQLAELIDDAIKNAVKEAIDQTAYDE